MQNTMNDLMGNMWKSMGDMNAANWMKEIPAVKDIDTKKIGLQILSFQKNAFDNIYNAMQQVEGLSNPLMKTIPGIPEEWSNMLKKNQEGIKKVVDESFVKAEEFLSAACSPVETAEPTKAEATKSKAQPKAK